MSLMASSFVSRLISVFFFLQAEVGIRYLYVTGVQTCALPICGTGPMLSSIGAFMVLRETPTSLGLFHRSEERRVGKECISRWLPYHQKKKAAQPLSARTGVSQRGRQIVTARLAELL